MVRSNGVSGHLGSFRDECDGLIITTLLRCAEDIVTLNAPVSLFVVHPPLDGLSVDLSSEQPVWSGAGIRKYRGFGRTLVF